MCKHWLHAEYKSHASVTATRSWPEQEINFMWPRIVPGRWRVRGKSTVVYVYGCDSISLAWPPSRPNRHGQTLSGWILQTQCLQANAPVWQTHGWRITRYDYIYYRLLLRLLLSFAAYGIWRGIMTKLERSLRMRRHEPAVKHISLLKSKPRCYTQSMCMCACTAKTSVLFYKKYLVITNVWLFLLCNFMNAVMKRIHAVGTDTWKTLLPPTKCTRFIELA